MTPQTMKARGLIGKQSVVILIDTGSTHNFLDPRTAKRAGIHVKKEGTFEVMVANGEKLTSSGRCLQVTLAV